MKPLYFVVNGILSKPDDISGWTDVFEDYYQNIGIACSRYEYFSGAITRFLGQNKRVNDIINILKRSERPIVYVGHSNGCELFSKVLQREDIKFEAAHLFAPAVFSDFKTNGFNYGLATKVVKKLYIYCSKGDTVLNGLASKTEWLRFIGLGYGTLGYTGPKNVLKEIEDKVFITWKDEYDHSDWFNKDNIENTFELTLRK